MALDPGFRRTFLFVYGLGLALCVAWPLTLQAMLGGSLQPGILGRPPFAQELGYTFTGLLFLIVLYVTRRSGRVRAGFAALDPRRRQRVMALETLLYSALFELSTLFGLVYHGFGGPGAERYARTFIALSAALFLFLVPRLKAWERAMEV